MKKIFCLFFAFVIVLLCGVNVFAASSKRIIGASIPNATSYELYLLKNGVYTLMQTSSSINFDLLSLDLDPGDHQFVVRATAPGFAPSSYSNVVTYSVSDFSYWNTSNVTSMRYMFAYTAENSSSVKISGLENWDTSKVIDMGHMFRCFGLNSSYYLDLSGWDVSNVDTANNGAKNFNDQVESKVIAPAFK